MIELVFFFLFDFLSFVLILDLTVSHFLFEFDFSLILLFLFSLSFIIQFGLLLLELEIFFVLSLFTVFLSLFFFHLFIEFFFYLFLEFLFSHFFEFFFFLEKFSVEFDQCGPFVIIIAFNLIHRFWSHRTGLRTSWWSWNLALGILLLLTFLWWHLAALLYIVVTLGKLLLRCLRFCLLRLSFFALAVFSICFNSFCDILFQRPQRIFCNFLSAEVISDDILNEFGDVLISLGEVFVKFVCDHLSQLFALLNGLGFLDCWMNFAAFLWSLGLSLIVLNARHVQNWFIYFF